MMCQTCPFANTDESEGLLSLGCLPEMTNIIDMQSKTGHMWECHSREGVACTGTTRQQDEVDAQLVATGSLPVARTSKLISHRVWQLDGEQEAIKKAK